MDPVFVGNGCRSVFSRQSRNVFDEILLHPEPLVGRPLRRRVVKGQSKWLEPLELFGAGPGYGPCLALGPVEGAPRRRNEARSPSR